MQAVNGMTLGRLALSHETPRETALPGPRAFGYHGAAATAPPGAALSMEPDVPAAPKS